MKLKVINYFLVVTIGLLPIQRVEASWFNQAKGFLSSGMQWVKSSFLPAIKPTIQQRNLLTPHELKGLHSAFKPEFAHLSLLSGEALMQNFTNIYRNGSPDSAFTKLLNDPNHGLFHMDDNGMRPTNKKTIPASSWGPKFLGELAADIHLNRILDPSWVKNEFAPRCKASHRDAFGAGNKARISRIETAAQALADSYDEMIDTPNRAALYPKYYLSAIPAAMLMHKAKTKKDNIDYIHALDERLHAYGAGSPLKISKDHFTESTQRTIFSGMEFNEILKQPIEQIVTNEYAFEARFAAEADRQLNGSFMPQQVKLMRYGYKKGHEAPNCSESALQDLCNIILAGPNGLFSLSELPKTIQPFEAFKTFYINYASYTTINNHTTGQAWMDLVSGHEGITYVQNNAKYEVRSYIDNLLKMLNILFGTTAQTYPEFGQQISTKHRKIEAETIEQERRVRFTITLDEKTIEAFLCVNIGKHTWLEVPQRESKEMDSTNTIWVNSLANILNDEKKTEQEKLNVELLLPQRQNISLNRISRTDGEDWGWDLISRFNPTTVAQATHIAYATRENAENPYDLFVENLLRGKGADEAKTILSTIIASEKNKQHSNFSRNQLFRAVRKQEWTKVEWLIAAGVDINSKNDDGNTVFLQRVLDNDQNYRSPDHRYSMSAIMQTTNSRFAANEISRQLIKLGADVNTKDKYGQTALHYAARRNPIMIEELIAAGARLDEKDKYGQTPLMLAIDSRNSTSCKLLLDQGAQVNITDNLGSTMLSVEEEKPHQYIRELLIQYGATS